MGKLNEKDLKILIDLGYEKNEIIGLYLIYILKKI